LADVVRGVIAYRRDNLIGAQRAVLRGIERLRGWIDHHMLVLGMLYQARCLQALGEPQAAHAALDHADDWLRQRRIQGPSQALLAAERARLWLRQGRLAEPTQWAQASLPTMPPLHGPQQLTLVRLWLAQARTEGEPNRLQEARAILGPLRDTAVARGWDGDLSEIELLEALVFAGQGQVEAAVERLAGVLVRVEPEGAVRLIADEGAPVVPLLHQVAAAHRSLRRFAQRLLNMIGAADPALELASADTLTALTARETEVLRLLAAGSSTQTIAAQLVVSPGTAKRHIGNILRKLAVHSRLEAVAQARARGLI
jgi:LuxR family transcriptional regulator, maltose regulon positive regulatory protein